MRPSNLSTPLQISPQQKFSLISSEKMGATDLDNLVEFGFPKDRAQLALKKSGSLQNAIEWLSENEDKTMEELSLLFGPNESPADTTFAPGEVAKSMTCDECDKKLRSMVAVQNHNRLTGHENFSESTEVVAPLTEEEKAAKLEELRALNRERKAQQAIIEKQEQLRNEKIRMKSTKEIQDAKEQMALKEQMKAVAQKRQEKLDDLAAKKRIKEKIAADKEARRLKSESQKAIREGRPQPADPATSNPPVTLANHSSSSRTIAKEARLRLQTPNGSITKTLPAETTLLEILQQVESETGQKISGFSTTYPKRTFSGPEDFGLTLQEAGLVPSAVLIVM